METSEAPLVYIPFLWGKVFFFQVSLIDMFLGEKYFIHKAHYKTKSPWISTTPRDNL
jgi:hypothetical protein